MLQESGERFGAEIAGCSEEDPASGAAAGSNAGAGASGRTACGAEVSAGTSSAGDDTAKATSGPFVLLCAFADWFPTEVPPTTPTKKTKNQWLTGRTKQIFNRIYPLVQIGRAHV